MPARVRLRRAEIDDVDLLHQMWTDPEVRKYLWDDIVIPRDRAAEVVDRSAVSFAERGFGIWVIETLDGREPIGFVGFRPSELEPGDDAPELLFGLLPDWWQQGLATEAVQAALDIGFSTLGFTRVVAATDAPNEASVRVLERIGMRLVRRGDLHGLDTLFFELRAPL
jgi:RimJ/RimL family protein N-acetyltransferase